MLRGKRAGLIVKLLVLALLVYMGFSVLHLQQRLTAAKQEVELLTQQVAEQVQTNTELSNAIENSGDPSFIKDIAREKLDLVAPNEKIFYITD